MRARKAASTCVLALFTLAVAGRPTPCPAAPPAAAPAAACHGPDTDPPAVPSDRGGDCGGASCPDFCHAVAVEAAAPRLLEAAPLRREIPPYLPRLSPASALPIDHVPLG